MNKYLKILEFDKILQILSSFCYSDIGKNLALNLKPSFNKSDVEYLQLETSEMYDFIIKKGNLPIFNFPDVYVYFKELESGYSLSIKAILEILQILKLSYNLKKIYAEENFSSLNILFNELYSNIGIIEKINSCIIDENTINDSASSELKHIRIELRSCIGSIRNKLNSYIHSHSKYIMEPIITIRNNRFVIPVKEEYKHEIKGFIHDISSSGSTVFIEPTDVFEINNKISSLKINEQTEIEKILFDLSKLFFPIIQELKKDLNLLSTIDLLQAKVQYSKFISGEKPIITEKKVISLIAARHPLIDRNKAVPIDLEIGKDFSTLLITGPNTGGKTVTLKTVGLLCLMTYIGLQIPSSENSVIYVFDNIFADIGDEQSISESLSTFSSHIKNIIEILNTATTNSLVLLDELGSGTDPIEGASLGISILEKLHSIQIITLVTTHYPEIKNYALVTNGFENASCEFDIENLKPTYKLLLGVPGKSNAFSISKRLGLSDDILKRAKYFLKDEHIRTEELLKNIYDNKIIIEKEKENIEKNSTQIELLRKSLENDKKLLFEKENEIINKAKQQARNIIINAQDDVNKILKELNNSNDLKKANKLRKELHSSLAELHDDNISSTTNSSIIDPKNIKIGNLVFIKTLNKEGKVLTLPNRSNEVQVQIGNAKMNVKIENLSIIENHINISKTSFTSIKKIKKCPKLEINVIGLNVEEANFVIDKYLDDSYLSGLTSVRIVHGKGSGKLREGIHKFLRNHPHVKNFRLGTFGEGEMGVTVVELK